MNSVLSANRVSKVFHKGTETLSILENIHLDVLEGDTLSIMGASGSGKTTLLNILGGLDQPTEGTVRLAGELLPYENDKALSKIRNQELGFVFQFHHLLPEFTALENTMMPLLMRGISRREAEEKARESLDALGLGQRVEHRPGELSGGEQQRVAIARALVGNPKVILADEPTGNLDQENASLTARILFDTVIRDRKSLILVTHNHELARECKRQFQLTHRALVEATR